MNTQTCLVHQATLTGWPGMEVDPRCPVAVSYPSQEYCLGCAVTLNTLILLVETLTLIHQASLIYATRLEAQS